MKYDLIRSRRLNIESLERHKRTDAALREMVGWLNDITTMAHSEQRHMRHTVESQLIYIEMFQGDNILYGVYSNDNLIGTVSTYVDKPNNIVNVGILIGDRGHWRQGFGFEAWKAVCDNQFKYKNRRKVEAGCAADNRAMMSICSHYGMTEEGRQDNHFLCAGIPVDLVHWGKFNEQSV